MQKKSKEELIEAFHMMWDHYPEQVRLIDRHFLVLAGNPAYIEAGGKTGIRCNAKNPELHKGCQAMAALNSREARKKDSVVGGMPWESWWIPVAGETDYYIHYTNGMKAALEAYKKK